MTLTAEAAMSTRARALLNDDLEQQIHARLSPLRSSEQRSAPSRSRTLSQSLHQHSLGIHLCAAVALITPLTNAPHTDLRVRRGTERVFMTGN